MGEGLTLAGGCFKKSPKHPYVTYKWSLTCLLLTLQVIKYVSYLYPIVAVGSSGILKAKQKLDVTFNFDKQDVIDFTKCQCLGFLLGTAHGQF